MTAVVNSPASRSLGFFSTSKNIVSKRSISVAVGRKGSSIPNSDKLNNSFIFSARALGWLFT